MASSVTVDKKLRKRIKKLAAEFDTTQGDIIEKAVDVFEKSLQKNVENKNDRAREMMKSAAIRRKNDKVRQRVREVLSKPGIEIDDLRMEKWGEIDED